MRKKIYRVTTCLENLEISGNLQHVREMLAMLLTVRELSGKCQWKNHVMEKYTNMHSFYANTLNNNTIYLTLAPEVLATVYLNISISFKNSA